MNLRFAIGSVEIVIAAGQTAPASRAEPSEGCQADLAGPSVPGHTQVRLDLDVDPGVSWAGRTDASLRFG